MPAECGNGSDVDMGRRFRSGRRCCRRSIRVRQLGAPDHHRQLQRIVVRIGGSRRGCLGRQDTGGLMAFVGRCRVPVEHEVHAAEARQPAHHLVAEVAAVAQHRAGSGRQSRQQRQPFARVEFGGAQHRRGDREFVFREQPHQRSRRAGKAERAGAGGPHRHRHCLAQQAQPRDGRLVRRDPTAAKQVDELAPGGLRAKAGGSIASENGSQAVVEAHWHPSKHRGESRAVRIH